MKKMLTALLAAAVAGALFVASPLGAMPKDTEEFNNNTTWNGECSGDDTMVVEAPAKLWPPNHKYYEDITVTVTDASGDRVDLTTTGTHNQYDGDTEENGAGNTADDIISDDAEASINKNNNDSGNPQVVAMEGANGSVTTDWDARSERSGRFQEGRTYLLTGDSTSSDGDSCTIDVNMIVPHDMRPSNR